MRRAAAGASIVAAVLCAGWIAGVHAQSFPSRAITVVVPFPPGGVGDFSTRVIGQKLTDSVKQPVVIENRPGAGGVLAGEAVRKAPADGHTLMLGTSGTHAAGPALNSKLPYDPIRDFMPVTMLVSTNNVLVVHAGSPLKSVSDVITAARSRSGGLSFASQGLGSGGHLLGEMFKAREKIPLVHILYKGSAPALADVLTGRVDIFFDALNTAVPLIREGKLRALAVTSAARSPYLPGVPTMAEAGVSGVESESWFGLFAVAGTPQAIVDLLNREWVQAARDPEVVKRLNERALDVIANTQAEFAARLRNDTEKLGRVVRESGAKVD